MFDGKTLKILTSFFAFDPSFSGGVFVASGNFDGDRFSEIVVSAGAGGGPNVRIFNIDNGVASLARSFFAYDQSFTGGVTVAAENYDGIAGDEIITGTGQGALPMLKYFNPMASN